MRIRHSYILVLTAIFLALIAAAPIVHAGDGSTPDYLGKPYTHELDNLHQIDGPPPDPHVHAYRLYRSGSPSRETFSKWCSLYGIERVIVMDGSAQRRELEYQEQGICPDIQVVYNVTQGLTPVGDGFLEFFDSQVDSAREDDTGLLFRCKTGSHRTGRLAAYYQMKYMGMSLDRALAIMQHKGTMMHVWNPLLIPQVKAMKQYIDGRPCTHITGCVIDNSDIWVPKDLRDN